MTAPDWIAKAKFLEIARHITDDRGPLTLFALVEREDVDGSRRRWLWFVAAGWFSDDELKELRYILGEHRKMAGRGSIARISRLEILKPTDPLVRMLRPLADSKLEITEVPGEWPTDAGIIRRVVLFTPRPAKTFTATRAHSS